METFLELAYHNLDELDEIAKKIAKFAKGLNIWTFEGTLGAGKTTLIQHLGKLMDVIDTIQSPTYAIVHQYLTQKQETIYHLDCYRLNDENEAMDIGIEEYFYSGNLCWIEWASQIPELIPEKHLAIHIRVEAEQRLIELKKYE